MSQSYKKLLVNPNTCVIGAAVAYGGAHPGNVMRELTESCRSKGTETCNTAHQISALNPTTHQ
jgi:hypothetical protein